MEDMKLRIEDEYACDPESWNRIIHVVDRNPVALNHCADILETVARICDERGIPMCDFAYLLQRRSRFVFLKELTENTKRDISTLKIKMDPGAYLPERAHLTDAGLDLKAPQEFVLMPNEIRKIDTGIHIAIPDGYVGLCTSKSGLMSRGVTCRGTIDAGYRGSIQAVLYNHTNEPIHFLEGQKITQVVILPCLTPKLEVVEELDETERGDGGFGSSGL